ncbi:MAG: hypothetical protein GXO43_04215 [Crenarchaeota archaeon]|nr:hypothetical protein [Thermoproteota archaeon]
MAEMYMGFGGGQGGSVSNELHMIGWLCGVDSDPSDLNLEEIMKKCISHGPYGYGLALFALYFVLNGSVPYHTFSPIPFGYIGRIKAMYVINGATLNKHNIIEDLGFYTMSTRYTVDAPDKPGKMYEYVYPNAFAVVIFYTDLNDRLNIRAFIVLQTQNNSDPFMAVLADDTTTEKLVEIIKTGDKFDIPNDIMRYGILVDKPHRKSTAEDTGIPSPEEEVSPEDFFPEALDGEATGDNNH